MALSTFDKSHNNIQKFIVEHFIQPCELGYSEYPMPINTDDFKEVASAILHIFRMEKFRNYNKLNTNAETEMRTFVDWCQGLPSVLYTEWYLTPCTDIYCKIMGINDKQRKRYKSLYTETDCEKSITRLVYNELHRAETNSL